MGPRPSTTVRPLRGSAGQGAASNSLEGRPPRPLDARTDSASLEAPLAETSTGPRHGHNLRLVSDHPRWAGAASQPLDRTSAVIAQPLHSIGGGSQMVSGGLSRHRPPHCNSRYDQRPVSLRPPLCRYFRRGVGQRRPVRTCLTPPTTVPPTLVLFSPARPSAGMGGNPRTQYGL